jgi:hypothetical protein
MSTASVIGPEAVRRSERGVAERVRFVALVLCVRGM